jgi:hypothetical protein
VPFFQNVKATDDHFTVKTKQGGKATSRLLVLEAELRTVCEAQLPSFFGNIRDVYNNPLV